MKLIKKIKSIFCNCDDLEIFEQKKIQDGSYLVGVKCKKCDKIYWDVI